MHAQTLTPLEPAEAWPLLQRLFTWLVGHTRGLIGIVQMGRISRPLWRDLNRHARALEAAARAMLLAMQTTACIVCDRPRTGPRSKAQPTERFPGDDPRKWSVSFRIWSRSKRRCKPAPSRPPRNEDASVCARNFAARLEAVRRVISSPGRASRRLARRLQKSDEPKQFELFDDLARKPRKPHPHEELFDRLELAIERIRDVCREVWRRRRDYLARRAAERSTS